MSATGARDAKSAGAAGAAIPVVDLSQPAHAELLAAACESIGFCALAGHGIPLRRLAAMRSLLMRLFDTSEEDKRRQAIREDDYRGYIPLGFFTPNYARPEQAGKNAPAGDAYEGYKLHWECPPGHPARGECALYGANRWAGHVPEMAAIVGAYWAECDRVAHRLLLAFSAALSVAPKTMLDFFVAPLTNMTLLHYPSQSPASDGYGIHPHRDTCAFTILHPDPVGGLSVQTRDGHWIEATCPADTLLMNIGEMMEIWSGGRFVATPHRVVNRSGAERYAYPWFAVPNHAVLVQPLVAPLPGFYSEPVAVGAVTSEVWRSNWPGRHATGADPLGNNSQRRR